MSCENCGAENPDANRFCGACGAGMGTGVEPSIQAAINRTIDVALAAKLTDQRIVEIDVQEKVLARLTALAKIVGIPIGLLLALLSLWGIKSLTDVDRRVKEATDDAVKSAVTKMNTKVDLETERSIASLKQKVDAEDIQIVQQAQQSARASLDVAVGQAKKVIELRAEDSTKQFDVLRKQLDKKALDLSVSVKAQNEKLGALQDTVEKLTGQQLTSRFEGVQLTAQRDPSGRWFIGSGHFLNDKELADHAVVLNGNKMDFKSGLTPEQVDQLLQQDLDITGQQIDKVVTVPLNSNQRGALADFVFNLGLSNLTNSTLLKELNAGHYDAVPAFMMRYTHAGGITVPGMVKRREYEVQLWKAQ